MMGIFCASVLYILQCFIQPAHNRSGFVADMVGDILIGVHHLIYR